MTEMKDTENTYRILLALLEGDKQFSQLLNEIKKGSLTKELRDLRKLRYIERRVDPDSAPPKSIYSLTKVGKVFLKNQKETRLAKLKIELKRLKMLDSI